MVPVTRLSNGCLLALFRQMQPEDQIRARQVCRKWAAQVPEASCRFLMIHVGRDNISEFEECFNKAPALDPKTVKLLTKADGSKLFPSRKVNSWNSLNYFYLTEDRVKQIAATFANIEELHLDLYQVETDNSFPKLQFDFLAQLLDQWRDKLITLKIKERRCGSLWGSGSNRFLAAINGLSALKNLTIDATNLSYGELTIMSHLEELICDYNFLSHRQFAEMIKKYGPANPSLARIGYRINSDSVIADLTLLSDNLRRRFTKLLVTRQAPLDPAFVSANFASLTHLAITPTEFTTFRHVFTELAKLSQLIYLRLYISFAVFKPDNQPGHSLPQMNSIKALEMDTHSSSHMELEQMNLGWTMPNLQAIEFRFYNFKCTKCGVANLDDPSTVYRAKAKKCLRQMFAGLKRSCAKLQTILHSNEAKLGTAEELLK